jgi:hypothetical protein
MSVEVASTPGAANSVKRTHRLPIEVLSVP